MKSQINALIKQIGWQQQTKMPTYAKPGDLVTTPMVCAYCNAPQVQELYATNIYCGIRSCDKHIYWAERDLRVHWHKNGLILVEDLLDFCHEINDLPIGSVVWYDALRRKRTGGSIARSSVNEPLFARVNDGIPLINVDTHNETHGTVEVLPHILWDSGVTKLCTDMLMERVKTGFYKADLEAHNAAVRSQE